MLQLYSAASQKDNLVASRIASSTKKDSIAMMAFTFITALFLPGTYIAAVFSTGMFNWMHGNAPDDDGRVVSMRFWIYWVTTIPLTTGVMVGWYFWYRAADAEWRKTTQVEAHAAEEVKKEVISEEQDPAELEKQGEAPRIRLRDRWRNKFATWQLGFLGSISPKIAWCHLSCRCPLFSHSIKCFEIGILRPR